MVDMFAVGCIIIQMMIGKSESCGIEVLQDSSKTFIESIIKKTVWNFDF
jgi:hypothetical protein